MHLSMRQRKDKRQLIKVTFVRRTYFVQNPHIFP